MRQTIVLLIALCLPVIAMAGAPTGHWKTFDGDSGEAKSIVKVYEDNGKLYGEIVELLNLPSGAETPKCSQCEGERKDQPIEGMVFLWGLEKDGDVWSEGTILDPANGETYDCKLWLEDGKLMVRGYSGFFYRTQEWERVER